MKFLTRCLLLSLCFVLLLGGSSVPVHAATNDTDTSNIKFTISASGGSSVNSNSYWENYFLNSHVVPFNSEHWGSTSRFDISLSYYDLFSFTYIINSTDNSILFEKGKNYTITISNLKPYFKIWYNDIVSFSYNGNVTLQLQYMNDTGESKFVTKAIERVWNTRTETFDYIIKFTPEGNVRRLWINELYKSDWIDYDSYPSDNVALTANVTAVNTGLNISVQSEEAGLLGGILGKLGDLWDKVTSIGEDIKYGFANIGTWFAELPGKIWSFFEDGLKNLFVPDEEYLSSFRDKWDSLMASRFGAVWQSGEAVELVLLAILAPPPEDNIEVPEVCINLPDSCTFTFGGWTVDIVPNGFEFLATACKLIVGIACSTLFVNGMIKRYDEVMGVEQ